ncbi:cellulase family glycosylhydrolase [Cellulomonas chengniuliangii]|uniref:Endoglucanase n=1 Tax=Cellulomonas chengniuliangii TaxID=2968084 RepID=A0ABY5KZ37_9CELL|nr:cellulase family glycosylhydrolase [Cellulomonas chengniuliangii]MCC2309471.1 cellulase family glycosylhydrolase [Cellulomonas chengniuliangii]MCC2316742.1 cellulase family glycosylhydrolase [Cellulomonas chengniuliangii]UUI74970.1 cellulase family glycosylhydrolase [Cellulomonas chengniuliangii]
MRTRLSVLAGAFVAATALALGGITAANAATPVGLHIEDGRLVERNGTPFVARGVSHAHTWYAGQTGAFADIKAAGANAVRVVLSSGDRWTKNDAADVADVVSRCKANKLVCMLEVHDTTGYGEEGAAITLDQAVDYWVSVKSAIEGQEDYVQLNIGNEPYGNSESVNAGWASDTSAAIKRLRAAGFKHNIVVDAPNWGQDWRGIMRDNAATVFAADPDANTLFSVHMYGVYGQASTITSYLKAFTDARLPLVIGEFGFDHSDGDVDEDTIMSEAQRLGIGYYGWSWSGNGGGVEYLDLVTGFDPKRLSPWGQRLINGANGIAATSRQATVYGVNPTSPPPTTPPPTTPPPTTPPPTTPPPTGRACAATLVVQNSWPGGFQGAVTVTAGPAMLSGWSTSFTLPSGSSVAQAWNGVATTAGGVTTVRNAAWNGLLDANGSAAYGFIGSGAAPTGIVPVGCTAS